MSQTLIVGSIALDTIETQHGNVRDALGGSASYAAVAASFFSPSSLIGIVGSDFPQEHIDLFRSRGIDLEGLETREGLTFRWHGYYERNMNNRHTNTTALNVFQHFSPRLSPHHQGAPFIFLGNIAPSLQLHVLEQIKSPKLVVMDTMDYWIQGAKNELAEVIPRVDVLMISDSEARQYIETPNTIEAGMALRKLGPRAVVIKKGENGALVFLRNDIVSVPAFPIVALRDPTGAGDVFAATFVSYLARLGRVNDENMIRATVIGCVMASFCVEDFSVTRLASAKPKEIRDRTAKLLGMSSLPKLTADSLVPRPARRRTASAAR